MDPIPASVRRLWDMWDLRIVVILSLTLQVILSLFGNRRKYISSLWFSILVWSAYLMADWVATVALGKLSDAQVDYENGNALWAIWAPLLLLHLGGPDSITAYSLEDNQLWMRHFFGLVVQFSVAVYVVLMSWKHYWFSIMSIPALVAGFIKYGERTWVLMSVSHDKSGDIVPFGDLGGGLNLGNYSTLEDEKSIRVLYSGHKLVKEFKNYMQYYDVRYNEFPKHSSLEDDDINLFWNALEVDDINLFWNALEVEMGLMFDLSYTKAAIKYSKVGWILRCITFTCTVTVLVGLIFRLIFMRENQEKWHEVDIAITVTLLVGALALEIYAIISLYLSSDWAMLWLIKHIRGKQVIQLRKKISLLFLPKQYWSKTMGQFDLLDFSVKGIKPDQNLSRRILRPLLGIDHFKDKFNKYVHKTAGILQPLLGIDHFKDKFNRYVHKTVAVVPPPLFNAILDCCQRLSSPALHRRSFVEEDKILGNIGFADMPLQWQILRLHIATEICYHMETEWDTHNASENSRGSTVSQQIIPPPDSSSLWEENKKLCRTLSHYMMHLLVMCPSLLPVAISDDLLRNMIGNFKPYIGGALDVRAACLHLWKTDNVLFGGIVEDLRGKQKDVRWDILKFMWLRILCYAASKGQKNEHLRQLTQGGELLTLLWFFLPQSCMLRARVLKPMTIGAMLDRREILPY